MAAKLLRNFTPSIHFEGFHINRKDNTVNGRSIEFGDSVCIQAQAKYNQIMEGESPVCQIDWSFRQWGYMHNRYYVKPLSVCDSMLAYIPCIKCGRTHKLVRPYSPVPLHYESILAASNFTFECFNCDQEYYVDDEYNVWVSNPESRIKNPVFKES